MRNLFKDAVFCNGHVVQCSQSFSWLPVLRITHSHAMCALTLSLKNANAREQFWSTELELNPTHVEVRVHSNLNSSCIQLHSNPMSFNLVPWAQNADYCCMALRCPCQPLSRMYAMRLQIPFTFSGLLFVRKLNSFLFGRHGTQTRLGVKIGFTCGQWLEFEFSNLICGSEFQFPMTLTRGSKLGF